MFFIIGYRIEKISILNRNNNVIINCNLNNGRAILLRYDILL
jgi:hypothetical protein